MDHQVHAELEKLLASMFGEADVRRIIRLLPGGEDMQAELPGGAVSLKELVHQAVSLLQRHGRLDGAFFDVLSTQRPGRDDEIRALAASMLETTTATQRVSVIRTSASAPPADPLAQAPALPAAPIQLHVQHPNNEDEHRAERMNTVAVPAPLAIGGDGRASMDRRRIPSRSKQQSLVFASLIAIVTFGIFSLTNKATDEIQISDVVVAENKNYYRIIVKASSRSITSAELRSVSISWTTGHNVACEDVDISTTNAATLVENINLHHYVISNTYVPFNDGAKAWVDSQSGLTAGHRHAAAFQLLSFCGGNGISFTFDIIGEIHPNRDITLIADVPKEIHDASAAAKFIQIPDCRKFLPKTPSRPERQPSLTGESVTDAETQALAESMARLELHTWSRVTVRLTTDTGRSLFERDTLPIAQLSCQQRLEHGSLR